MRIFLLATGGSINDISDEEWNILSEHDTMGISWFMKKNFETKYYYSHEYDNQSVKLMETVIKNNWETNVYLGTLAFHNKTKFSFNGTPKSIYEKYKNDYNINECGFSDWIYSFNGKSWNTNEENPPYEFDEIWANNLNEPLFGFRGTLMCAINLCTVLGYTEIILCGVDLNNGLHFYKSGLSGFEQTIQSYNPKKHPHSTQISVRGSRGVLDGLIWVKENLNKRGIELKVLSEKSLLYKKGFELYDIL